MWASSVTTASHPRRQSGGGTRQGQPILRRCQTCSTQTIRGADKTPISLYFGLTAPRKSELTQAHHTHAHPIVVAQAMPVFTGIETLRRTRLVRALVAARARLRRRFALDHRQSHPSPVAQPPLPVGSTRRTRAFSDEATKALRGHFRSVTAGLYRDGRSRAKFDYVATRAGRCYASRMLDRGGGRHVRQRVPGDGRDRRQQRVLGGGRTNAVETAANTVRDLRVAEVVRQDVVIENGQVSGYRVRLALSFKYDSGD